MRSGFMKTPATATMNKIVREFIDRTGNDALKTLTCACCASETAASNITEMTLDSIPNRTLLQPASRHPDHDIYDGMLLEPQGVDVARNVGNVCDSCFFSLERNRLPLGALANNMWIGRIPPCLQALSLAERLLIAKYLPTAYVLKLYPKQTGAPHWDHSQLYSGLKGSVATYALDPRLVLSMVDGKILPWPALILSATIAVTFITPSGKSQHPLPDLVRVRRRNIRQALEWLKLHNGLYRDMEISEDRLQMLPEDGVPNEIMSTVKHSTDMEAVTREHEGYVPVDDESQG